VNYQDRRIVTANREFGRGTITIEAEVTGRAWCVCATHVARGGYASRLDGEMQASWFAAASL